MESVDARSDYYKKFIREIPDFPRAGVSFKDLTPLLSRGDVFASCVDELAARCRDQGISPHRVACPEARGFLFGAAVAYRLGVGVVPIRKTGKLPYRTIQVEYALEYGVDRVEMHVDAVSAGERILIVDDVLATGGTMHASVNLVQKSGGTVAGCAFLVELEFLHGRDHLPGIPVISLVRY
jgi:adenine phosphoribosyltransferase